jgi:hypothetical protein
MTDTPAGTDPAKVTGIMKTINIDQLSFVSGGQTPTGAVVDFLNSRFGSFQTTLVGKPHFGPEKNGVEQVSGKFRLNDLVEGGPPNRSFTADFHVGSKTITNFQAKPLF